MLEKLLTNDEHQLVKKGPLLVLNPFGNALKHI
jgi:hypothetical protein